MVITMPRRTAQPNASSANRSRKRATATATLASVCNTMATPITVQSTAFRGVLTLKWLVVPRADCAQMMTISSSIRMAVVQPTTRRVRTWPGM
jgi:hypothetical protein